jgi:pimeloyl-ACP methyl ester carboxylesterase
MIGIIHSVSLHGSLRIPYVAQGDPGGTPVLLLHGYADSWRSFEPLLPHLPSSMRAIAPTQRGHGDAGRPAQGYTPQDFAEDAVALLDALGIGRAVVVGHSMGGQTALRLAVDHPRRVLGTVLIDGFATLGGNPVIRRLWNDAVSGLSEPVDPGFAEEFQRGTVARPVPEAFLRMVVRESLKLPARVWRAALRGQMDCDLSPELGRIAAPTLLLYGDRDAIVPRAMQDALAAAIPAVRLAVLSGVGHAPHWEEPQRVAAEIARFALALVGSGNARSRRAA